MVIETIDSLSGKKRGKSLSWLLIPLEQDGFTFSIFVLSVRCTVSRINCVVDSRFISKSCNHKFIHFFLQAFRRHRIFIGPPIF